MKNIIIYLLIITTLIFSCKKDNSVEEKQVATVNTSIVGTWLRSDYDPNTNFEYKIMFEESGNGAITSKINSNEGVVSNATSFNWAINDNNNTLTITQAEENNTTPYTISSDGDTLVMADFSNLEFTRQ